ncbi:unnamed protein product, partial [Mesorhabditis spiculigera]
MTGNIITEANSTDDILKVYHNATHHRSEAKPIAALVLGGLSLVALGLNLTLLIYILVNKLYHNFISSHFISHLCITNIFTIFIVIPMYAWTLWTGVNIWEESHYMCRIQTLLVCTVWTVMAAMHLCTAGVHLLTFARIHYEQLFGLAPKVICVLSWVISVLLALPAVTNGHIVVYDPNMRSCVWGHSDSAIKFLAYVLILGVFFPVLFSSYAYVRVLGILYHSPIVFQSIGLYKSRWLVYAFLITPFYQLPFYLVTTTGWWRVERDGSNVPIIAMCVAFTNVLISPVLYGASLFMMKEEDMTLTARAHKAGTAGYHQHHNIAAQAQLI